MPVCEERTVTIETRLIDYADGDVILEGLLAWDDSIDQPRPGVMVSHAWAGRSQFEDDKAVALAELGYVGFADRYREAEFAVMPDPDDSQAKWAPFGYDATGVIIAAIRLAAETEAITPKGVAAAMGTFRHEPYQGVIGTIQFDEFGDLLDQPVYFQKVVNGQWVDVMPGDR